VRVQGVFSGSNLTNGRLPGSFVPGERLRVAVLLANAFKGVSARR